MGMKRTRQRGSSSRESYTKLYTSHPPFVFCISLIEFEFRLIKTKFCKNLCFL